MDAVFFGQIVGAVVFGNAVTQGIEWMVMKLWR